MAFDTIKIGDNSVTFDRDKTRTYQIKYDGSCDCIYCKNFYELVKNNAELVAFLETFGIDYHLDDDIFSIDVENTDNSPIDYIAYYGVIGFLEKDFEIDKFGVKIAFSKSATVPSTPLNAENNCFWVCIMGKHPYIISDQKDSFEKTPKTDFKKRMKNLFKLKRFLK